MAATRKIRVGVGTYFRSAYADSNSRWIVVRAKSPHVWVCEINNENIVVNGQILPGEWNGTRNLFTTEQILSAIRWENTLSDMENDEDKFYKNLKIDQIVHVNHFGGMAWIRCRVVEVNGEKTLLPIALVGSWSQYDLPMRRYNGTIDYGYHASKIRDKEPWQPHSSSIWEGKYHRTGGEIAPNTLAAINLEVVPMTKEEEKAAKLWAKIDNISEFLRNRFTDPPQVVLEKIREMAKEE